LRFYGSVVSRDEFAALGLVHEMPQSIAAERWRGHLADMLEYARTDVYSHQSVRDKNKAAFPGLSRSAAVECSPQGLIRRQPIAADWKVCPSA
jgi:hypothetical protein